VKKVVSVILVVISQHMWLVMTVQVARNVSSIKINNISAVLVGMVQHKDCARVEKSFDKLNYHLHTYF
jgi:ABC-type phosphate/phosphonate transport system ATPase subunit